MQKKRILFVDDEPNVLSGLRRMLRCQRNVWEMEFANGGQAALASMQKSRFEVVVTDMRMPGIDGAELLGRVSSEYPDTVRLVLSGQSEHERIFRAVGPAHQFLSKPCDPEVLIETIESTSRMHDRLRNESLRTLISQIDSLPSLPSIYRQLVTELESDDPSLDRVGELISSDVAMTAKTLQLVNSSFFGLPQHVTDPKHAAALLGLNILQPLVLSAKVFTELHTPHSPVNLETLMSHSLEVAVVAREIASSESACKAVCDDAFLAGVLHDVGKLILGSRMPEAMAESIKLAEHEGLPRWEAERQVFGTTHGEVGAYLLGLWGLPMQIVEAVALHHFPHESSESYFSPLTAVHAANTITREDLADAAALWDEEYLDRLSLWQNRDQWRELSAEGVQR